MSAGRRVLYAEDSALDADLTRAYLAEHAPDLHLEIAETGQACLDRLSASRWDVLLLDHHLPDMEGLDVLRALVHGGVPLPVVLVTGSGDEDLVVKALHLGAANYVPKVGNYVETLPDVLRLVIEEHRLKLSQGIVPSRPRRVLFVEHHPMDIDLTLRHFAEAAPQFELDVSGSCAEALTRLGRSPGYDAAVVDLRMPDQSGLDFVREAKRRGLTLPPFVMISGKGDEGAAIASLALGAADYVAKREGYLDQLPYAVDHAIVYDRLNRVNAQLQAELAERRRAHAQILEQRATLDAILESASSPIFALDRELRYTAFNRAHAAAMKALYGADVRLGGGLAESLTVPADLLAVRGCLDRALRGEVVTEATSAGGEGLPRRYFEVSYNPVRTDDREIIGVSVFAREVTERKRAEEERERLEEQLRVSQKMEAVGRLAGGIAHDFNNLLSVILSFAEFAIGGLPEGHLVRSDLREVKGAAERAAVLTRQLLAFSRKQILQPVPLDLNEIVAGVEKMCRRILGEDIEFMRVFDGDLGRTMADPSQIEQVLMNLVVNARDAMPEGGKLTVETSNVEIDEEYAARHLNVKPGSYVQLVVTDTGCGMDSPTRARIFEPFFTTKEEGKGTGLGLSTVYGIVKQSGGDVWVYSEVGKGTTFKVYLPRDRSATKAPFIKPAPAPSPATGTETILLVEDEEALRRAAVRALESAGYSVLAAAGGEEALLASAQYAGDIHVLVTDVVMPHLSGVALAAEIAKTRPKLAVLYMSGYADGAVVHHGVLEAGTHFLAKPFTSTDLTRKVREVLDVGASLADGLGPAMGAAQPPAVCGSGPGSR